MRPPISRKNNRTKSSVTVPMRTSLQYHKSQSKHLSAKDMSIQTTMNKAIDKQSNRRPVRKAAIKASNQLRILANVAKESKSTLKAQNRQRKINRMKRRNKLNLSLPDSSKPVQDMSAFYVNRTYESDSVETLPPSKTLTTEEANLFTVTTNFEADQNATTEALRHFEFLGKFRVDNDPTKVGTPMTVSPTSSDGQLRTSDANTDLKVNDGSKMVVNNNSDVEMSPVLTDTFRLPEIYASMLTDDETPNDKEKDLYESMR